MSVLVTGGAGYIGSHVAHALVGEGRRVVVLDDLSTGRLANVPPEAELERGDVGDAEVAGEAIRRHSVTAVLHFAGSIVVPQSVADPLSYYRNNTCATRTLLEECVRAGVRHFVFSSTAAVYGIPERVPAREDAPLSPIPPYGTSKLMIEWILRDVAAATALRYFALRYFNVAGADQAGRTGQPGGQKATHLIKVACQAALGMRPGLAIYGTDYPTTDGTCVRDYIHVTDLADAHLLALRALESGGESRTLNCGYGRGFTVREVLDAVRRVSGVDFAVEEAERRAGDPPSLVSDPTRLREQLGWVPRFDDLDTIVESALAWEARLRDGG